MTIYVNQQAGDILKMCGADDATTATIGDIAKALDMNESVVRYYVNELIRAGLVSLVGVKRTHGWHGFNTSGPGYRMWFAGSNTASSSSKKTRTRRARHEQAQQ